MWWSGAGQRISPRHYHTQHTKTTHTTPARHTSTPGPHTTPQQITATHSKSQHTNLVFRIAPGRSQLGWSARVEPYDSEVVLPVHRRILSPGLGGRGARPRQGMYPRGEELIYSPLRHVLFCVNVVVPRDHHGVDGWVIEDRLQSLLGKRVLCLESLGSEVAGKQEHVCAYKNNSDTEQNTANKTNVASVGGGFGAPRT